MNDIATYIRIVDATPSDEAVTKCSLAVNDIATRYTKRAQPAALLRVANDIAVSVEDCSKMPADFVEANGTIINKHSASFVPKGNELHILVCALLAAKKKLAERPAGGSLNRTDVLAAGLWSALSIQEPHNSPKLEELRAAVLDQARAWALDSAESSRLRVSIPEVTIELADGADVAAVPGALKSGVAKAFDALRKNAELDREELNILWWALGDWSDTLNSTYSQEEPHVAAVLAGIDLGRLLRRLPADGHRHLLMRIAHGTQLFTLAEVIGGLGDKQTVLAEVIASNPSFEHNAHVFPLMTAIVNGASDHDEHKLTAADWGARSLLESALLNIPQMLDGQ